MLGEQIPNGCDARIIVVRPADQDDFAFESLAAQRFAGLSLPEAFELPLDILQEIVELACCSRPLPSDWLDRLGFGLLLCQSVFENAECVVIDHPENTPIQRCL